MSAVVGCSPDEAVYQLQQGNPVALPTETVYGLAAPLYNESAILKVYTIKQRPLSNPLIVHVLDEKQLELITDVSASARLLVEVFWPGPLTLILPKKSCVPSLVTAGQSSVAVRAPQALLFRAVLEKMKMPLVAPSANKFQQLSPTCAQHVLQGLGDCLTYILDGGPCALGVESTILSLLDARNPILMRYGPIAKESMEEVLKQRIRVNDTQKESKVKLCPGLFRKHYSPSTPLYLVTQLRGFIPPSSLANNFVRNASHVFLKPPFGRPLRKHEFCLTQNGNLKAAAAHLFAMLQLLDSQHFDSIWIEKVPHKGIGCAINDRLSRAASKIYD